MILKRIRKVGDIFLKNVYFEYFSRGCGQDCLAIFPDIPRIQINIVPKYQNFRDRDDRGTI